MQPLSVYVHIPFCVRKCAYCDFASYAGCRDLEGDYFRALFSEIDAYEDLLSSREIETVFFGGGTPSAVDPFYIEEILARLQRYARFAADAEITLEANPGTLTEEKLRRYLGAGINRLSIGVQSFDDGLLRRIGRIHTSGEARDAVTAARAAGFSNISVDLMYGLPGQTAEQWARTLREAAGLGVDHISAYSLILEEGTPLFEQVRKGLCTVPDEDAVLEMQRYAVKTLAENGYFRYEISNYAHPGFESRHNSAYWTDGTYLGLGSAAHSLVDDRRFENPRELSSYISGERRINETGRTPLDRMEETIMLATRMTAGLDLEKWERTFGECFEEPRKEKIERLQKLGLVTLTEHRLRLTERGLELQDAVVLELI